MFTYSMVLSELAWHNLKTYSSLVIVLRLENIQPILYKFIYLSCFNNPTQNTYLSIDYLNLLIEESAKEYFDMAQSTGFNVNNIINEQNIFL